jgi:hypothetical protein
LAVIRGDIIVGGFWDRKFFAENETKQQLLFSVPCGGGHRLSIFQRFDQNDYIMLDFTYLRSGKLHRTIYRYGPRDGDFDSTTVRLHGGIHANNGGVFHGRETRCVTAHLIEGRTLFFTGGEDTYLNVYTLSPYHSKTKLHSLRPVLGLASFRNQTVCVNSIVCVNSLLARGRTLLFSSGACENLRVGYVDDVHDSVNFVQLSVCPRISDIPDTRIMNISVLQLYEMKYDAGEKEKEQMMGLYLVCAAYSDAVVRLWLFDERRCKFCLIGRGSDTKRCYLIIRHHVIDHYQGSKQLVLFTSDTGGYISFWDVTIFVDAFVKEYTERPESFSTLSFSKTENGKFGRFARQDVEFGSEEHGVGRIRAHQSGVKSVDLIQCQHQLWIASGGDDNALHVAILDQDRFEPLAQYIYSDAHASSIQGRSHKTIYDFNYHPRFVLYIYIYIYILYFIFAILYVTVHDS